MNIKENLSLREIADSTKRESAPAANESYVRVDVHQLHFQGSPVQGVPHVDFRLFGITVKHFPWGPVQ